MWRKQNKLTQAELGERVKKHQATISKMEKAIIPVAPVVAALVADVEAKEGERALILRRRHSKTLIEAAGATGIHENILSEMERGLRHPVAQVYVDWLERHCL